MPPAALPANSPRVPAWMRNVPFVALHLGCLGVFFANPGLLSLVLFVVLYFARCFGTPAVGSPVLGTVFLDFS